MKCFQLLLLISAVSARDMKQCTAGCRKADHCCVGLVSGCQHPSCDMGCLLGVNYTTSVEQCEAKCKGCDAKCFCKIDKDVTFEMCGECPSKHYDPGSGKDITCPDSGCPWWPPGNAVGGCGSCGGPEKDMECVTGCKIAFDPSYQPPSPPTPAPPSRPVTPVEKGIKLSFSPQMNSSMVLQQAPAKSAVYGFYDRSTQSPKISVTVSATNGNGNGGEDYSMDATTDGKGRWKAFLKPTPASKSGSSFRIEVAMKKGELGTSEATAAIENVVFGDVW